MFRLKTVVLFACSLSSSVVFAQAIYDTPDPNSKTEGCQNPITGFHENGDLVTIGYHGAWADYDGVKRQNGGFDYSSCEIRGIDRIDSDGNLKWRLEPGSSREDLGFAKQDRIYSVATLNDGSTAISSAQPGKGESMHVTISWFNADGSLRWYRRSKLAPKFAMATVHNGPKGDLLVDYSFSNFGYKGGKFSLEDGKTRPVRKNSMRNFLARLDAKTGDLKWERDGLSFPSVKGDEIFAVRLRHNKAWQEKLEFHRVDPDTGKSKSVGSTDWKKGGLVSVLRQGNRVYTTSNVETVVKKRVQKTEGVLRTFKLNGALVGESLVSQNSRLVAGNELYLVSPIDCFRGPAVAGCMTSGVEVQVLGKTRKRSVISEPGTYFYNTSIGAAARGDLLLVYGETFAEVEKKGERGVSAAIIEPKEAPSWDGDRFVWRPLPPKPKSDVNKNPFGSF